MTVSGRTVQPKQTGPLTQRKIKIQSSKKNYKDDDDAKEYDVVKNDNLKDDDVNGEENASKNDL